MKRLSFLSAGVLFSPLLQIQKGKGKGSDIPAFGSVEKFELEMKESEFDKNAESVIEYEGINEVYKNLLTFSMNNSFL